MMAFLKRLGVSKGPHAFFVDFVRMKIESS